MGRYLVGRVLQTVLSMLVVVSIVFVLTRLSGSPIHLLLDVSATERDQEILTRHLGLDRSLPVQYGLYVRNVALGDFGNSILTRRPVTEHILERLPATIELGVVAMLLSVLIGVPLGVYSAVYRGRLLDRAARVFAVLGQSMPTFWLGLMLILFFGVVLGVLPAGGRGGLLHLILPASRWATSPPRPSCASPARPCWRCSARTTSSSPGCRGCRSRSCCGSTACATRCCPWSPLRSCCSCSFWAAPS